MNRVGIKKAWFCVGILFCCSQVADAGVREVGTFFKGFVKDPGTVGAIFPCTSRVGEELVKFMLLQQRREPSVPLHILEVGAGTGSMTEVIVKYLRPIDHLDLVEISPEYCRVLQQKFMDYSNVSIYCMSITEFRPDYAYDIIICTLPFMSLDVHLIEDILNHLKQLIAPGGFFSFVGYTGIPEVKRSLLWGKRKQEHCAKLRLLNNLRDSYQIDKTTILGNCPPINIYHLCITK